jgi:hypothetical protein
MSNTEEVLFTGDRQACREFIAAADREGYSSLRIDRVGKSQTHCVVGTVLWAPSPEEIEAAIAPIRERLKKHPRYSDSPTVMARPKRTELTPETRVSKREESPVRVPQGWRP